MTEKANAALEALAMEGENLGGNQAQPGPAPEDMAKPVDGNAVLLAGMIPDLRDVICRETGLQSPKVTLNDQNAQAVAEAVGPLLTKYGIDLRSMAGAYSVELSAAFVLGVIGWGVYKGVKQELEQRRPVAEADGTPAA